MKLNKGKHPTVGNCFSSVSTVAVDNRQMKWCQKKDIRKHGNGASHCGASVSSNPTPNLEMWEHTPVTPAVLSAETGLLAHGKANLGYIAMNNNLAAVRREVMTDTCHCLLTSTYVLWRASVCTHTCRDFP